MAYTKEERAAYIREWQRKNREKRNAYAKQWRKDNPDKNREAAYRWREKNPEAWAAAQKRSADGTKEVRKERQRERHRRLYDTDPVYRAEFKIRARVMRARSRSALCPLEEMYRDTVEQIYRTCPVGLEVDHIEPLRMQEKNGGGR